MVLRGSMQEAPGGLVVAAVEPRVSGFEIDSLVIELLVVLTLGVGRRRRAGSELELLVPRQLSVGELLACGEAVAEAVELVSLVWRKFTDCGYV